MIDTSTDAGRTEATLRQLMADQAAAMRSRNADYLASRYAAGAVTFDLAPPLQSGGSGVDAVLHGRVAAGSRRPDAVGGVAPARRPGPQPPASRQDP
jgi:ketosteroid isomerase-like protein